jgi:hypothetical protein
MEFSFCDVWPGPGSAGIGPIDACRSDRNTSRSEPRGREIVTQEGVMIAVATDPAMSEEIARRLNKSYWSDQEDQWAL